ncbi:hypothetical protein CLNEO_01530 [Anaerotignum neopropionicum]|uniref:DUF1294 domain-containing protein n=1 Tax=Anaerotignum neopropionicum TaxID=36847 RepID=A0A136WHV2_9FIRM|nr:DUF1294 domain-containing protein [Anaerotignum neopropionicum]KXL54057.1 hypothetical protein CLNEO_01530 [Anaerotignum neopropionicum]
MAEMHFNGTAFAVLAGYYFLINLTTYGTMGFDKKAAINHKRRIPEKNFYLMAILGGGLGGLLAQIIKRHKTRHLDFVFVFTVTAILHILVIYFLMGKFIVTFG